MVRNIENVENVQETQDAQDVASRIIHSDEEIVAEIVPEIVPEVAPEDPAQWAAQMQAEIDQSAAASPAAPGSPENIALQAFLPVENVAEPDIDLSALNALMQEVGNPNRVRVQPCNRAQLVETPIQCREALCNQCSRYACAVCVLSMVAIFGYVIYKHS